MSTSLPDEPKDWRKLQAKALREKDPNQLARLLRRMLKLLSKQEQKAKDKNKD